MQTPTCRAAVDQLLAALQQPATSAADLQAALAHIEVCTHCRAQLTFLRQGLMMSDDDQLTCQECEEQLPDYLQAMASGQGNDARWRAAALHVRTCPACAATAAELADLLELAHGRRGMEPTRYPVPRLDVLRPQPTPIAPWRLTDLGRLVIALTDDLLRQMASPAPAYNTGLKGDAAIGPLWQLVVSDGLDDLEVTITAEGERATPSSCTLVVKVAVPSRGALDLAGSVVVLRRSEREIGRVLTDAFGEAAFPGIDRASLGEISVEIEPER